MEGGMMLSVRGLFRLAKLVGIEQREVAEHIGVSDATVSLWANGKAPVPDKHVPALTSVLFPPIKGAYQRAYDLKDDATMEMLQNAMEDWRIEVSEAGGQLYDAIREQVGLVARLSAIDPAMYSAHDRHTLSEACAAIQRHLGSLDRLNPTPWATRLAEQLALTREDRRDA
jgi:transcriptional regulator with XRE-family HTH domain